MRYAVRQSNHVLGMALPALFSAHVDDISDAVINGLGSSRAVTATQLTVDKGATAV